MEVWNFSQKPLLDRLNSEETRKYLGGIILVSVLMVFGLIGNVHVLLMFAYKRKSSNHTTFIYCLGIVDMISCSVCMPFTLIMLLHPMTFHSTTLCKKGLNLNYFICISSALILIVISADRYQKLCKPMKKQLSTCMAKLTCIVTLCVSYGLAFPTYFFFELNSVETGYANITGHICTTDSDYITTKIPTIYHIVLMVLAGIAFVALVVIYVSISRVLVNRGMQKSYSRKVSDDRAIVAISTTDTSSVLPISISSTCGGPSFNLTDTPRHTDGNWKMHIKNETALFNETKRKTVTFFIIVAIYFCSYLPNIILNIATYTNYEFFQELCRQNAVVYHMFKWVFFVNNAANPIVYLFLDVKFRAGVKAFYCKAFKT